MGESVAVAVHVTWKHTTSLDARTECDDFEYYPKKRALCAICTLIALIIIVICKYKLHARHFPKWI